MNKILFALPGNETLTARLSLRLKIPAGQVEVRKFPDGETYIRVFNDVRQKETVIVATLYRPDEQAMALYFLAMTLKDNGAAKITIVAPYLPYLRQDAEFKPGEALSATYFAGWISGFADELITIDPHLHRITSLEEIYTIPVRVYSSADKIAAWIKTNVKDPLILGPDEESEQWAAKVATKTGSAFLLFEKKRRSERNVAVSAPPGVSFEGYTPVIVDDVISTGHTMIAILKYLTTLKARPAVCIGIHAAFAPGAYQEILQAGAETIVTTDTITYPCTQIDIADLLVL